MFYIGPTDWATIAVPPITLRYYCINCCEEFTENSNYYLFTVYCCTVYCGIEVSIYTPILKNIMFLHQWEDFS